MKSYRFCLLYGNQKGGFHILQGTKGKDTVTLEKQNLDKAAKLTTEHSKWGDDDLVQNLEAEHEISPKTILSLH